MSFPWPVTDDDLILNEALDTAMRYFDLPRTSWSMPTWNPLPERRSWRIGDGA